MTELKICSAVVAERGYFIIGTYVPAEIGDVFRNGTIEGIDDDLPIPLVVRNETTKDDFMGQVQTICELTGASRRPIPYRYFYRVSTD